MARPAYTPAHASLGPASIAHYLQSDSAVQVRMLPNPWLQGDHTKAIIVDAQTAFLGGMNIGREYRYEWHDLMVAAQGPVVDALIRDFENAWARAGVLGDLQAIVRRPGQRERESTAADYPLRLLYTRAGDAQILRAQVAAMRRARNRIWIQNAYLTSDLVLRELVKARRRGVDVRVILPYQSDSGLIDRSNALAANSLLQHGVRVYIYPGMSHLKAAVYDVWLCLGSANFDKLSLRLNQETNIATSHAPAVAELVDRVFLPDFAHAVELTAPLPVQWLDYLKELIADHL
jgi:cardiolipin synthase